MSKQATQISPQTYARAAGVLYLAIIVCGLFSEMYVRSRLVVTGDAAVTAGNILASEGLFRIGFAADTIMVISDVALAVLIYVLLRPVSQTLALMAAAFRLVQTVILAVNLLTHHFALLILKSNVSMEAFKLDQLNALALLLMDTHAHGYDLGLLFFGVNCLIVGYLVFDAAYLPRVPGILISAAGLVYLTGSYLHFLAPRWAGGFEVFYLVPLVAETTFCVWLILKGVNTQQWYQCVNDVPKHPSISPPR